jgi:hypothetical protein
MLWQLVVVVLLVSFNMFVADALVRMRRDVREIHTVVAASSPVLLKAKEEDSASASASASPVVVASADNKDTTRIPTKDSSTKP